MNKKILFYILLAGVLILPLQVMADVPTVLTDTLDNIEATVIYIGTSMIVIGFVVAGIMYLMAAGSPEKIGTAKKALIASLIGAVIVVLSMGAGTLVDIIMGILGIG